MDGIGPRHRTHRGGQQHAGSNSGTSHHEKTPAKQRHSGEKYFLVRSIGKVASKRKKKLWEKFQQTEFAQWPDKALWRKLYTLVVLMLFIFSVLSAGLNPLIRFKPYQLTSESQSIIPEPNTHLGTVLKYDAKSSAFAYNAGFQPAPETATALKAGDGDPRFSASFPQDASKGVSVTDPYNNVDFKLTPKFKVAEGKQNQNQVIYPMTKADGFLVYTAQTASVKEDLVLQTPGKDKMTFDYDLDLGSGLEARMEQDGSIGIYGSSLPLYGNVATGSDKDVNLLQKAKENATKDKFLFGIPAPTVKESGQTKSSVLSHFELKGSHLALVTENLKKASYPLTIDPSIYIQTAAQLMTGNNESNVSFDVATEQFKKGFTTGARINNWTETGSTNDATYDQSVAAAGGYVYRAGGRSGRVMPNIADTTTTTQGMASTSTVLNMPATRPSGDLYVAVIAYPNATVTTPLPTGWTLINSANSRVYTYYHVGGGSEPSTYTWPTTTSVQYTGSILRIKNADTSGGTISTWQKATATGTTAPVTFPAVTPGQQGALVLSAVGNDTSVPTAVGFSPSGYSAVVSSHSTGTSGAGTAGLLVSSLDSPPSSGASTGSVTASNAGITSNWGSTTFTIYGSAATAAYNSTVQWAHFNSTSGSIDSPSPGSDAVACTGWCTNSAYNLPTASPSATNGAGLVGMSMVAYNGYLYAIGGYDGSFIKSTVYIAKLGANGEPSLWHPTNASQASWVYWYKDAGLNSAAARMYQSAYAYNGKMYVLGGDNNTATGSGALTTVEVADILPNGTLGTWSSGTALSSARSGLSVQGYNGYLYAIGGDTNGTTLKTVEYTHLNSDGTMNSWQVAAADGVNTMTNARTSMGGVMSAIWGGYLYVAGGCGTLSSGKCSAIDSDMQLASINSDGTLDVWNTMANLNNQRFGASFVAWQGSLYRFGGCSKQDASTGDCYATHMDMQYGNINQDGDASTVSISQDPTNGNCVDPDPYDCSLAPGGTGSGQGGQMLVSTAILNGYIYVIGGCTTYQCTTMSPNTSYAAIDSNGRLKSPPTCAGGTNGAWCIDSTNTINGTNGLGAGATTVFGGNIYVVGGHQGNATFTNAIFRNTPNADGSFSAAWTSQRMTTSFLNFSLAIADAVTYSYAYARANPSNASTYPGNLYIFGGCTTLTTGNCTGYTQAVYKCNIKPDGSIDTDNGQLGSSGHNPCVTTNQLQIGTVAGASGVGLALHAGAVYANYVYLIGGSAPGTTDLKTVRYAKFDNSNNIVTVGSGWTVASNQTSIGRSRGAAFGYNGYLYVVGGYNTGVSTTLKDIQFAKINVGTGDLGSFNTSIVTINQRWGLGLSVSNSYAYVIGGCTSGTPPNCASGGLNNTVQTFQMYNNDSGAPANYSISNNMYTTDRLGASAAVKNGYIYVAGGCTSSTDCTASTSNVQKAQIDANGNVGTWSNTTATLGTGTAYGQLELAGGTLYYIGGQTAADSTAQSTIYYSTFGTSGDITAWNTATKGIGDTGSGAQARTQFSSAVWNNRIYVTGGYSGSAMQSTVFVSPQLSSGGDITTNWTSTTAFTVARSGPVAITYANNIYVLGGYDGTNYLSDVQFAKIDSSGTVGSWTYTTSLPSPIREADGFAANGYMYIFGGRSNLNDCAARTLIAPISANTTIATGNNPTGIGEWYQTNRNFDGGRYGVSATYYQGKSYLIGGGCQGIVMQDNFDGPIAPYYDALQWTSIANMQADFKCQSTSTSRTLSGTVGGAVGGSAASATTKDVTMTSGGTLYFKLYMPVADTPAVSPTCYKGESVGFLFPTVDNITLEYSTNLGANWTTAGTYNYAQYDPLKPVVVTVPSATTIRYRWYIPNGGATDSFALEDVYMVANGSNGIAYATGSRVTQTGFLSQPQLAIYSRQIDAGSDVFPTKWLMNGLDNSIGARWQFSYRSMNDPLNTTQPCGGTTMSAFGQTTNFGDVTLGVPNTYTVKNSGGTNIGCGRYFFMTISIDASQTYGYPDDITRGPTLDNLTLFYNSNPGKRLIHGKTFTEGIQQPLDTQP